MKQGFKTLAFWAAAAVTALSALVASGAAVPGWASQGAGAIVGMLTAAGYASWRSFRKGGPDGKPAWKTSEFWLSVAAAIVAGLLAAGVFPAGSTGDKLIAGAASLLALLGYQVRHSLPPKAPQL